MNYKKDFNRDLSNRFANTYDLCNKNINKLIFVVKKRNLFL